MENRISNELQIGKAGEYLVCADLCKRGMIAYPSEQGLPYDVVIDIKGRLLKCQVKTTMGAKPTPQRASRVMSYMFHVKRCGKNGKKRYTQNEIDVFALVALDSMQVGYIYNEDMPDTILLRSEKYKGLYHDEKGIDDFRIVKSLESQNLTRKEISTKTGLNYTTVCRMMQKDYEPFMSTARYLSDLGRDKKWFAETKQNLMDFG